MQNHGLEENLCPNVTLVLEQRTLKLICGQDHFFGVGKDELLLFLVPNYCAFLKTVDRLLDVLRGSHFWNLVLYCIASYSCKIETLKITLSFCG